MTKTMTMTITIMMTEFIFGDFEFFEFFWKFSKNQIKSLTQMLAAHTPTSTLLGTFQAEAA